jgi:hypothetical protein
MPDDEWPDRVAIEARAGLNRGSRRFILHGVERETVSSAEVLPPAEAHT